MKTSLKIRRIAMLLVAALACWASPASANTISITISENTKGSQLLPFTVTEGVLILCEEGTVAPCDSSPSDIVFFQNFTNPIFGGMFGTFGICSDLSDADSFFTIPADSATCAVPPGNLPKVYLVEPAGGGDITYTPTAGQPGFAPDPTYIIKGDGPGTVVPEPASLLLIGSGLGALAARLRRRESS